LPKKVSEVLIDTSRGFGGTATSRVKELRGRCNGKELFGGGEKKKRSCYLSGGDQVVIQHKSLSNVGRRERGCGAKKRNVMGTREKERLQRGLIGISGCSGAFSKHKKNRTKRRGNGILDYRAGRGGEEKMKRGKMEGGGGRGKNL